MILERTDYSLYGGAEHTSAAQQAKASEKERRSPRRTVVIAPTAKDDGASHVAPPQDSSDFLWLMTEEPHRSRRAAIMKAHPEVTKLMGYTSVTKYVVAFVVGLQFSVAYYLRNTYPLSWKFIALAYIVGGTANHNLFLAIHEITHNLAFKSIWANKSLAIFANLPIGIPYAAMFKRYHMEHHRYLGEDGVDTDLPSRPELLCLNNVLGKVFFATFQILFYALRPGFIRSQTLTRWHAANFVVVVFFDYLLISNFGLFSYFYLLFSSFFAGSLHPCAGHFIGEHYLWDGLEQETYSYYGPLNLLAYNVGYHNEHHDFPSVAWTRLPALKALAPEFYDTIPSHPSWPMIIVNFIRDPEVGIFARAKRKARPATAAGANGVAEKTNGVVPKANANGAAEKVNAVGVNGQAANGIAYKAAPLKLAADTPGDLENDDSYDIRNA
ncbi:fatty acid desaturase-domain-containing protein [Schizophyllum amplum]|uniref:sphingolipid 4-desaturase n=1 Tax=Schizophyllum amplum TaxID=97359 RepID=A0A550CKL0_9AGAR|nr:fatty acid desaturase-domain-containing protein [Auriculariopsis ampla]